MSEEGAAYADVLAEAQALGFAEADPSADVDGHDAAAKCAIIASLAFDTTVHGDDVFREGIRSITSTDIDLADRLGYVIKLLGIASESDDRVAVRVHPTFLPKEHPLAGVRESFNAIYVRGRGGRRADVLRARRRRHADRVSRRRGHHRRRAQPAADRAGTVRVEPPRQGRCVPSRTC